MMVERYIASIRRTQAFCIEGPFSSSWREEDAFLRGERKKALSFEKEGNELPLRGNWRNGEHF